MPENKKSRLCEILGVEENEYFKIRYVEDALYRVRDNRIEYKTVFDHKWVLMQSTQRLIDLITYPDLIIHGKFIDFTRREIEVLRKLKERGVKKIERNEDGLMPFLIRFSDVAEFLIPPLAEGQTIDLTEMDLGDDT